MPCTVQVTRRPPKQTRRQYIGTGAIHPNLLRCSAEAHPTGVLHTTGCRRFFDATVVAAVVAELHRPRRRTGAATCQASSPAPARASTCGLLLVCNSYKSNARAELMTD